MSGSTSPGLPQAAHIGGGMDGSTTNGLSQHSNRPPYPSCGTPMESAAPNAPVSSQSNATLELETGVPASFPATSAVPPVQSLHTGSGVASSGGFNAPSMSPASVNAANASAVHGSMGMMSMLSGPQPHISFGASGSSPYSGYSSPQHLSRHSGSGSDNTVGGTGFHSGPASASHPFLISQLKTVNKNSSGGIDDEVDSSHPPSRRFDVPDDTDTSPNSLHCWHRPTTGFDCPGPRAAHSCDVLSSSKLFVFAGWNGKKALNDLYVLDVDKMSWSALKAKNPPAERNNHTTAVVGHRLFAHGGHDGSKWLDDLHVLDTEACVWKELFINGKAPSARACHTLTRVHDKLFMFGGYDGQRCFNDIDILDLDTLSWIQPKIQGEVPLARNAHSMTVVDSKLYLFGGHSGNKHLTDLHLFESTALRWSQPDVIGNPPPGLRGHTANLIGDRIYLFGGYDGKGRSNELFVLDTAKLKWIHPPESENAPVGRQRHSACLVGARRLFIFGGFDGNKWLNDLHILDIGRLTADELTDTTIRSLMNNLRTLVGSSDFSDVTLVVDNREIPAHRNILAAQCPYFRSMFSSHMKESREQRVIVPDWSYAAFMAMLGFLYTGRMKESRPSLVCDVLGIADQYGLDGLKTLCESNLQHSVDSNNVCSLLKHADRYRAPELKKFCKSYIFKHADEVTCTKAFEELATIPSLLIEIAKLSLTKNSRDTRSSSCSPHNSNTF